MLCGIRIKIARNGRMSEKTKAFQNGQEGWDGEVMYNYCTRCKGSDHTSNNTLDPIRSPNLNILGRQ